MDERLVADIRRELDVLFPEGGYALTVQPGEPPLRLTWEPSIDHARRRASEQILRKHQVAFETEGDAASRRRAMRIATTGRQGGREPPP